MASIVAVRETSLAMVPLVASCSYSLDWKILRTISRGSPKTSRSKPILRGSKYNFHSSYLTMMSLIKVVNERTSSGSTYPSRFKSQIRKETTIINEESKNPYG